MPKRLIKKITEKKETKKVTTPKVKKQVSDVKKLKMLITVVLEVFSHSHSLPRLYFPGDLNFCCSEVSIYNGRSFPQKQNESDMSVHI